MNFFDILLAKKLENDQDPTVEGLTVTQNGSYSEQGVVYDVVNVALPLDTKTITQNGTYDASDDDLEGYSSVNVNLPLATKSITANGNYKASDDNLEGYTEVDEVTLEGLYNSLALHIENRKKESKMIETIWERIKEMEVQNEISD